jgi:hypothetical protein
MPDLLASLQDHDLGHLHIVAGMWGLELSSREAGAAAEELAACMLDAGLVSELTESLPAEAGTALRALIAREGRIPWAEFTRRFGQVREMGPGKRDRENPQFKPASPAETLYYRALLARAFFDTDKGPQEFAYVPADLLPLMGHEDPDLLMNGDDGLRVSGSKSPSPENTAASAQALGRPASPGEHGEEALAGDRLLDDATTLLAALRLGITPPDTSIPRPVVQEFLRAAGLIKKSAPQPEPVKRFLEAPRGDALKMLVDRWIESESFNELQLMPGIICEGEWSNQPLVTREFLLSLLEPLPDGKWWSLPAFIRAVKEKYPDYQRPAGDYDSWFIKRAADGTYLRGFSHWDNVDGALISYFITGILHWLGMADLARGKESEAIGAFRLVSAPEKREEKGKLAVASNGIITVSRSFSRAVRYQVSRFGEWEEEKIDAYRYRVTPVSLKRAQEQGLKVEHLLALLAKYTDAGIPPVLVKALKSWEANGTEARVQNQVVLRVSRPEILEGLHKSKAARFLGENLGPTSVVVKEGAQSKVMAALTEMGLLAEDESTKSPKGHAGT